MSRSLRSVVSAEESAGDAWLFEVSWEACNQVGGIYQVLRSKAPVMTERWRDRYLLVGPDLPSMADVEFESEPASDWVAELMAELAAAGTPVRHGRWLVSGRPRVLLLGHAVAAAEREALRQGFARATGIEVCAGNPLLDDVIGFAVAVRRLLLAALARTRAGSPRLLAHFHEWLGGAALLLLGSERRALRSVFTTHATSVGRYIASSGGDLYESLPRLDGEAEATRFGILPQHRIERACARDCDVFTTVSPITGEECQGLLGRSADRITPNGLNIDRFDVGHDFQTLHAQHKEEIHRFVMGHFFPSYSFDLERTRYFFTSGRFEPRNKGFDMALEAMARLNAELRALGDGTTVVFFIVTSRETRSLDPHALEFRGVLEELREVSERVGLQVAERLFRSSAAGRRVPLDDLVDEYWRLRHRRMQHAFRRSGLPPVTTHVLPDADSDPVLAHLRMLGLENRAEDPVKVVYHPEFISPVNPLWRMEYEHFVRGCHLGIFPSSYEPWGYTPLECVAMGVPAVTSDLAGFGRFVADAFPDHDEWGLVVLGRRGRGYHDAAAELARSLLAFCRLDRRARIALRNQVELHSRAFDWTRVGSAYHDAHDLALSRDGSRPAAAT